MPASLSASSLKEVESDNPGEAATAGCCPLAVTLANVLILSISITSRPVAPPKHEQDTAISTTSWQW